MAKWCTGIVFAAGVMLLVTVAAGGPSGGDAEYVGSKKCKKCHIQQYKSWEETNMALAFHALKPNADLKPDKKAGVTEEFVKAVVAAKEKAGVDPEKDYTQDPACLKCHTTGYGKPGGYAIPDGGDKKAVRAAEALAGVGCEACHGPGSKYVEIFEGIQKEQRQYTQDELYAAGMIKIDAKACTNCHIKEGNPTAGDDYKFDFDASKDKGSHAHEELKLRK